MDFADEFNRVDAEITALKNAKLKAASLIRTESHDLTLDFTITTGGSRQLIGASKAYIITCTSDSGDAMLSQLYMSSSWDGRLYPQARKETLAGKVVYIVIPIVFTESDYSTVYDSSGNPSGKTVAASIGVNIITSSNTTVTVSTITNPDFES